LEVRVLSAASHRSSPTRCQVHSRRTVEAALNLADQGLLASEIAHRLGVSRWTVRDWIVGNIPHSARLGTCPRCLGQHDLAALPAEYVYLLGLYLGDGCLSRHARDVYKLRIILDAKYPGIIEDAVSAVQSVSGRASVLKRPHSCVEVYSFWRSWICLFPQHGPGKKHDREIRLDEWQLDLAERWPERLLRGLIQSDGCRFQNTGRGGWVAARYAFSNRSSDIHGIFRSACDTLGLRWTAAKHRTTYVSRKADVAKLDEFIGPKC
jgi:hypothetical protein